MTADLLTALAAIEADAKRAQAQLAAGLAPTGHSALRRIQLAAADAQRHATQVCDENERKAVA